MILFKGHIASKPQNFISNSSTDPTVPQDIDMMDKTGEDCV